MVRTLLTGLAVSVSCLGVGHAFGGAYLGVDLGIGHASIQHKYSDVTGSGKVTKATTGAVYGAHAGYLYEIGTSKTIVGGELYGNTSSPTPSFSVGTDNFAVQGEVKIKRTMAVGGALVVGKMFNLKTMLYGRLAYEFATFEHRYNFNATSIVTQFAGKSVKKNVSVGGAVMGLGLAYKVSRMMMAGAEYQFAGMYGRHKSLSQSNFKTEIEPVEHRLLLKVSFVFG